VTHLSGGEPAAMTRCRYPHHPRLPGHAARPSPAGCDELTKKHEGISRHDLISRSADARKHPMYRCCACCSGV